METKQRQQLTEEHYESFPFEFLTAEDEANIEALQPAPFRRFVNERLKAGMKVAEIGCGPGRGTLFMVRSKLDVVAVDLSKEALRLAELRAPEATFVHASNLELPFPDESFDAVISDGVIHHTPDPHKSLKENARILKPKGKLYLGVYRRKRYYYYVYTHLGRPVRWLEKRDWGRALIYSTLLPVYYAVHLIKSRGKRTWKGAKNFFFDYIITPQATFHTRDEIEAWGDEFSLMLEQYVENVGNVHVFLFVKKDSVL